MPAHARSWGRDYPTLTAACPNYVKERRGATAKGDYVVNVPLNINAGSPVYVIQQAI